MEPQEQSIKKIHPHFLGFLIFYFFGFIFGVAGVILSLFIIKLGIAVILIGVFIVVLGETSRRAETFYLLDNGVAREFKLLSTSRKFAEYHNIQNIEVNQSFIENIFGLGSIKFDTSGSDLIEVSFHGVKDPYGIEKIVREKMKNS